jgi:peptidoglycan hydrolase CwlO-like protein
MLVIRRIFGLLLIIATVIGLVFSLVGIFYVWKYQSSVAVNLQSTLTLMSDTHDATAQGLVVTEAALKSSVDTVANMQSTIETTAKTIESTNPMIDEIADLMDNQLPQTIRATQSSLLSAQESARTIDQMLTTLSAVNIPLIGPLVSYNPDKPLSESLGEVASSLDGLPESFAGLNKSLRATQSNVQTFQADLTVTAASVGQIKESVAQYEKVVAQYQQSLDQVNKKIATLSATVPSATRTGAIALTVFLIWMALAQIGLAAQGWEMFTVTNM